MKRRLTTAILAIAMASSALLATSAPAQAHECEEGTTSLAEVLAADGDKYDRRPFDFDILERAVLTVIGAKPESPVALLADGETALTAFLPTDRAFKILVKDLTGKWSWSEKRTFERLAALVDVDTLEAVLLYHVVPGETIKAWQLARADGESLATAQGGEIKVDVSRSGIWLEDADPDDYNPRVLGWLVNINKGNKQIAHGISRVLRPIDL